MSIQTSQRHDNLPPSEDEVDKRFAHVFEECILDLLAILKTKWLAKKGHLNAGVDTPRCDGIPDSVWSSVVIIIAATEEVD